MKQFIILSTFKPLYQTESDLLDPYGLDEFIVKLKGNKGQILLETLHCSNEDFNAFLLSIKDPSIVVFHGWIEQNSSLRELLVHHKFSQLNGEGQILNHHLLTKFKAFVSPFLSDLLLKEASGSTASRKNLFSYLKLLDPDHRTVVEEQVFKTLKVELLQLKDSIPKTQTEEELVNRVRVLCSDENIYCINQLSKSSYALKLLFVDTLLSSLKSRSSTKRLANWIIKKLESLELNKEHEYKLSGLRKEVAIGKIGNNNNIKRTARLNSKTIISTVLIIGVVVCSIVLLFWDTKGNEITEVPIRASSFKSFTKQERVEIDSLLRQLRSQRLSSNFPDDTLSQYSNQDYVTLRQSFVNPDMEDIYLDYYKDALIQEKTAPLNCSKSSTSDYK